MLMNKYNLPEKAKFQLVLTCKLFAFLQCVDFTCLMDKKMEMLKNSFSLFMFKKITQLFCQVQRLEAIDAV